MIHNSKQSGIAALPITLSVMAIALLVALTLALVGFSELLTSKSSKEAKEAFYVAEFGVQDALMRLARGVTSTISYYQPDLTSTSGLWVGVNDAGTNLSETECDESATPTTPNCSSCDVFMDESSCAGKEGCIWDVNCTGTPVVTTKVICSKYTISTGTPGEKKALIQVVADMDSKGIITQCSWEQL